MLKSVCSAVIWAGIVVFFSAVSSHAQIAVPVAKTDITAELNQNPFDYVQSIVENSARNQQGSNQQGRGLDNSVQSGAKSKFGAALKYHKKDSGTPEQVKIIYDDLVQKYGAPKSVRGQSHVWDIENPNKSSSQADMVTVILKMENFGTYELIMDRDRGEDGRATWDATRIQKAHAKSVKQKKSQQNVKPLLFLQEDND